METWSPAKPAGSAAAPGNGSYTSLSFHSRLPGAADAHPPRRGISSPVASPRRGGRVHCGVKGCSIEALHLPAWCCFGALCRRPSAFSLCTLLHLAFTTRVVASNSFSPLLNLGNDIIILLLLFIASAVACAAIGVPPPLLPELTARSGALGRAEAAGHCHAGA